ncbi:MAG TPA: hypothetical protein IAD08_03800 [Candidatus Scatovivens faecipullorum]|nr:hypothetical protein [Candidatus Scatovivens faecipullorum]
MAIKSEEKNERAIVSKRLPSFAISRKRKASTVDTSVSNVSSKKSKRTVVRKNKKKLNNINLEASEIKEVQEVQEVVSEIPEEISNTNDINDKKQETAEVTISLETVTKKSNENINSNASSDEMVNEKEIINKTILDEDVNIDKLITEDNNSSISKEEINEEISQTINSDIDEISNEIKNNKEEKKAPTVITPDYTVHKSRISRRNLSFNLNKNLDNIVVTNPKDKEPDISINQNAPFFYEPSVFQKFNIDVIDADSDKENDNEIDDSQINLQSQEDLDSKEFEIENNNNNEDEQVISDKTNEDIKEATLDAEDSSVINEDISKDITNENIQNDKDIQLDTELDAILTELIKKEIEQGAQNRETIENKEIEVSNEVENNISTNNEITEETQDSYIVENTQISNIKQEETENLENNNNNESDENIVNDSNSENNENFEVSDIESETITDTELLETLIDDTDNVELLDDIIGNTDNTEFLDEFLENHENIEDVDIIKEAADNITDSKNVKAAESAPFFDSSIPKIDSEINKNNFSKKPTFSNFSNIFRKFTFDETNFKNIVQNNSDSISISNQVLPSNQNILENLENSKKSVKELEVSASPATLIIPTINTDETQFSSTDEKSENSDNISEFYNIITPASLDTKPDYDDYEEDYREKSEEPQKESQISNENIEENKDVKNENTQNNDTLENTDDINIDNISINDLDLLDNIELNDLETLSSKLDEDEIDEDYINENPIHDDTYFENSNNQDDSYLNNEFIEDTEDSLEAENYDFESKKMSNYFSEDDDFSIEDYFGLKDLKNEIPLEENENNPETEDLEEYEDTDAIEFDNTDKQDSDELQEENSQTDISTFSKLIENFTQTISTLSERIADLEENKNSNKNSYDTNEADENNIEAKDNEEEFIEDTTAADIHEDTKETSDSISPTEIIDGEVELENIDEDTEIIDDNNTNIFEDISLDDISLDDIDDISLEDIEKLDNPNIEIDDNNTNTQEEDAVEFDLPLNDNGITDEPNLFDSISVDDINLDDFSLEDIEEFEKDQAEDSKFDDTKAAKDIITKTFSAENSNINDQMKSELLSELEGNTDIDKALLENSADDLSDNAVTSDLYKIIDTLAETITQLESSPDMEDKQQQIDSNEILNVPAELTGEGKAINILINKDDIFSISILNETYEIVADFDGISVLSENIHISTPKKNFFVKIGEKYIEIHNKNDNFLVYTNFEDIEFANAINNVAFAKKNNKIELNIKEAFKISSTNNIVELSMLNTSVADIVNSNSDNSQNIDESSICDNRTLLISEETQKVYLPYTIEEVMKKLHDSNEYQTVEEVIENEYTVPLATFKMPIISRFKEAYRFMRVKEKSSVYAALDLALELMFTSNLNPAVIRAAKDLKELNIYLDCLYENEVDKFDCFKIVYKVLPKIK